MTTFTKIDDTHYEFEVTGMMSGDTATASIAGDRFTDINGNGNEASTGSSNWVMYDTTAPQAFAINVNVDAPQDINHPILTWSTTDGQSGIDHYTVSTDGNAFTTQSSGYAPTLTPASSHSVTVRAYDRAGNYSEKTVVYPPTITITAPTTLKNSAITDTVIKVGGPIGMIITDVTISGAGSSGFVCNTLPHAVVVTCSGGSIASSGTLTVTATSDGGVTTDNSQDYVIDEIAPTVTINQAVGQADPTNVDSAVFRLVFSEPINEGTLSTSDIMLSGTTGAVTDLIKVDSRTWDITVTGMTHGDTVMASLPASSVTDLAGNSNTASTSTDNQITYDNLRPTATINQKIGQADPTNVDSAVFTIIFSEPITGFEAADLRLTGSSSATVSNLTQLNSTTWEAEVTGMTNGDTVQLAVLAAQVTDLAGNPNVASTSTDNSVTYDTAAPTEAVDPLITSDTTPKLTGTVNDPSATVTVTVNGTTYPATNNGDGTWTLADNTITPALAEGVYDITVNATDIAENSSSTTAIGSLTIDTTAPTGTVDPVDPSITNSPAISGTVSDATATVTVTIDGHTFTATNNGDGTWSLPAGTIAPALGVGTHTATTTFQDAAGNQTTESTVITIQRSDADIPTVNPVEWVGGKPIITGTYDAANSQSLTIRVNGTDYMLGSSSLLTTNGNTWTLDLGSLSEPLPEGTHSVSALVTTRDGTILGDVTTDELRVLAVTIPNVIAHPGQLLAQTGSPFTIIATLASVAIIVTTSLVITRRLRTRQV